MVNNKKKNTTANSETEIGKKINGALLWQK